MTMGSFDDKVIVPVPFGSKRRRQTLLSSLRKVAINGNWSKEKVKASLNARMVNWKVIVKESTKRT